MKTLRIALVAGEASGDYLGAELMSHLRQQYPNIQFEGVGGPKMIAEGCNVLFDMERLSVTGFTEVLGRIFELVALRRKLINHWRQFPPQLFIGIDAPAFNLGLEQALKANGVKTIHYVSPQVWAWRAGRIKKIKKSIQLMMTVFPFENDIYIRNNIPVEFVGHPLADAIPFHNDKQAARKSFNLKEDDNVLAILPGSRTNEIRSLAVDFFKAANLLQEKLSNLHLLLPLVHSKHEAYLKKLHAAHASALPLQICIGQSRLAIAASDAVLLASGTATLETLLIKRPMVAAYRLNKMTYWLAKRMVRTPFIAMPNLLAGRAIIPELVQNDIQPESIVKVLLPLFLDTEHVMNLTDRFTAIHRSLKKNASDKAAKIVLALVRDAA